MAGRKTKLTPELKEHFLNLLRSGNTIEACCGATGIGERTYFDWMAWARIGKEPFSQFSQSIKKAQQEAHIMMVDTLVKLAKRGSTMAAIFWLQNRFPDQWKDLRYIEGEIKHKIEEYSDEQLDRELRLLLESIKLEREGRTRAEICQSEGEEKRNQE